MWTSDIINPPISDQSTGTCVSLPLHKPLHHFVSVHGFLQRKPSCAVEGSFSSYVITFLTFPQSQNASILIHLGTLPFTGASDSIFPVRTSSCVDRWRSGKTRLYNTRSSLSCSFYCNIISDWVSLILPSGSVCRTFRGWAQ